MCKHNLNLNSFLYYILNSSKATENVFSETSPLLRLIFISRSVLCIQSKLICNLPQLAGKLGLNCKYPVEKQMDCEYHILETLAYAKVITFFLN